MRKRILFLIKDATHCNISIYGNTYWKTRILTGGCQIQSSTPLYRAPSTIMSNMCIYGLRCVSE